MQQPASLACWMLAACLCRQPFSSFEPATGQYVAAVGRLHALTEAVYLFALPLFGLVGLKHGSCTSFPFGSDNLQRRAGMPWPPLPMIQAKQP